MTRPLAIIITGALLAGTGSAMGGAADQGAAEKVGDSRTCISNSSIANRIVEDERTIRFEMLGRRIYRNRLSAPCPGLQQARNGFGTLAFDLRGDQLCRGDLLRVVDPSRGGTQTLRTATACPLGAFERLEDRPARR